MSEILNGTCKGGPLNDRGLTHDRPTKLLLASNNDGQEGVYHHDGKNLWVWDATMNKANELETEVQIKNANKTAPRVTPETIDDRIFKVKYYRFPDSTLMVCAIELMNGYHVVGEAGCASNANFDEAIGRRIAYDDARRKIWALEGYVLRNELKGL